MPEHTLKEIVENPAYWEGKEVVLKVNYLGWGASGCKKFVSFAKTRSDVTLESDGICVFSDPLRLSPTIRKKIKIRGKVECKDGRVRLSKTEVLEEYE